MRNDELAKRNIAPAKAGRAWRVSLKYRSQKRSINDFWRLRLKTLGVVGFEGVLNGEISYEQWRKLLHRRGAVNKL
jgi:hypothetical protein